MSYEGGYYLLDNGMIRSGIHTHTKALSQPMSQATIDALNRVQRTPWRVNRWLLDVMTEAYNSGSHIGNLPYVDRIDIPRKTEEQWAAMSDAERNQWKFDLSEIHSTNAKMESRRHSFLMQLSVARELQDRDAIWFPHFLDFRGRYYPMPQGLTPQADDTGKALLEFAEGQPLGLRGLFWLGVRLANTFGHDKVSLKERYDWATEHTELILDSYEDPLDGRRFWTEADEPWGFLATCREWAMARASGNAREFVSHLPIQLDGSCNGLQHLSAMGRDPIGARATNVAANTIRQDIYTEVLNVVERLVADDAVAGNELAHEWVGRLNRKVVKRAVMTTPYGVTERGIAEQLMQDGHTEGMDQRGLAATYLKDKIVQAMDQTVTSAKQIMAWVQEVAATLGRNGEPFLFETPTGNTILQSYFHLNRKMVSTVTGRLVLWEEDRKGGLQARKQMLAAAPNLIHAFDASHMTMTINALAAELGDTVSFSMIHDSFGVHANRVDTLNRALREQFVEIYQHDWLARVEAGVRAYAPHVDIPRYTDFITLGDFDVHEVLRSEFFFA